VEQFRLWLVLLIWLSLGVCLVTGYFYSPTYRARKSDNPRAYWAGMGTSAVVAIVATVLLIRG
jgi:hypothetical protein